MNKIMQQFVKLNTSRNEKSASSHKESCISCSSTGGLFVMREQRSKLSKIIV